jgi:hypothetical protein
MMESREQIREADFEEILNYYKNKGQLRHQTLMIFYLYTSIRVITMFKLRWEDVYDFDQSKYCRLIVAKTRPLEMIALNFAVIQALKDCMKAENPAPHELILNKGEEKEIWFVYRVIREAMDHTRFDGSVEPSDMRLMFRETKLFHNPPGLRVISV